MSRTMWSVGVYLLMISAAIAQPGPGGGRGGLGRGPQGGSMLLGIPEVQAELALTDDQKKEIVAMGEKAREAMRGGFNFQELQNLPQEERQKKMEEFRAKSEDLEKKNLEAVKKLLDEKQNARFAELSLQREGIPAIGRPEVAEKLGLSAEQKEKVAKLREENRPQRGAFGGPGGGSEEERRAAFEKMRQAREKYLADLQGVLTDDQKASWEKLLGKKFEFPAPRFGGPGGGRPQSERKRPASE